MSPGVVNLLHFIHISEEHLSAAVFLDHPVEGFLAVAFQAEPVVQLGQSVMDRQVVQHLVEAAEQFLLPDVFNGNFQEVENTLMQVHLCRFAQAVHGDVADGIGVVVQGIEDKEPLPGQIGFRQKLPGGETDIAAAGQNHFRTVGFGILGPFGFFIIIEVVIIDAQENIMAAENGPVAEHCGGQVLQVVGFKQFFRQLPLQQIE